MAETQRASGGARANGCWIFAAALAGLLAFTSSAGAKPRPGDLDRSFGGDGLVRTLVPPGHSFAYGLAIGNHGRIVVSGHNRSGFALARYKPDGRLDRSLSGNGKLSTGFGDIHAFARAVAIGHRGSIVAAGETCPANGECRFAVAKYTSDGHLDPSFGDGGRMTLDFGDVSAHVSSVALEPRGRVLLAGDTCIGRNCDFALARLDSRGVLDRSFGNDGRVVTLFTTKSDDYVSSSATSMAVDAHGRIVVGGVGREGFAALARYQPNGDRDHTFGHDGEVLKDLSRMGGIRALALDAKDKVVAVGFDKKDPNGRWALARFGNGGGIDTSFGDHGQVSTGFSGRRRVFPHALAIDSKNRIVVAGEPQFALARYQPNGNRNRRFGSQGRVQENFGQGYAHYAYGLAIDSRDRPVVAGVAKRLFAVARFLG
jgi:uncharacterized delta-60 repeat protein